MLRWGEDYFKNHNIESPRLTMELILCEVLNYRRIDLYLNYDRPLKSPELDKLHNFVLLAGKQVPLQYIFGNTQFLGIELLIDKRALIPRPETEILAKTAIDFLENYDLELLNILDIGTGSGCLAVSIAYYLNKIHIQNHIDAIDISADTLELAKANAKKYNLDNIEFQLLDILKDDISLQKYNCIVSNPPYIPLHNYEKLETKVLKYEPQKALTDFADGLTFYKRFKELIQTMQMGAIMMLEIEGENTEDLLNIYQNQNCRIEIIKDFAGIDRILKITKEFIK